jgi:hypothetical protein
MILIHNFHRAAKQADKTTFPVFGGIVKRRISQIASSDPWRVCWTLALGRDRFCCFDLVKILMDYWLIITILGLKRSWTRPEPPGSGSPQSIDPP